MLELLIVAVLIILPLALVLNARKRGERQRLEARRARRLREAVLSTKTPPPP